MIRVGMSQIVSSMRHRGSAYASLVLEVALGCTVVAYALGLGSSLRETARHSLGFDLDRTFAVTFDAPAGSSPEERAARELNELRSLRGVEVAAWVDLPPLSRRELPESVLTPAGPRLVWTLRGDAALGHALGAKLSEGRWLEPADQTAAGPTPVLVTRELAAALGPKALGTALSGAGLGSLSVVGVLQDDLRLGPFYALNGEVLILPHEPAAAGRTHYLVRTTTGSAAKFQAHARAALGAREGRSVHIEGLPELRDQAVRNVGGAESVIFITVLGVVLVVLVGSIGMASSLIVERRRQIGIRRALGARRADIVGYFMLENLLATLLGIVIGAGCCILLDQLLMPLQASTKVAWREYLPLAAGLFVVAGQLSVWLPAQRAACGACCVVARIG